MGKNGITSQIHSRLEFALEISDKLAEYQLDFKREQMHMSRKSDDSPVTVCDLETEKRFRDALVEHFPDDGFFGEESGQSSVKMPRWVLDPIDGTRKFMRGLPFWAICIAFETEENIELGVVHVPAAGKKYWAARSLGAFCNGEKIKVDESGDELNCAFVTMPGRSTFKEVGEESIFDDIQQDIEHDPGFLDAYSYAMVADGRIHAMMSCGDKWWDIAAPIVIIEEAGGCFTTIDGDRPREDSVNVAACPRTHEQILAWIKKRK